MFQKLLKHEFKSQSSLLGWLTVAVLGAGGIGAGVVQLLIHIFRDEVFASSTVVNDASEGFLILGMIALLFLAVILMFAIAAYSTAVRLMLLYRFYKHHFTDEGYLTFTLPATTHQILLSSTVNILIWTLISTVAVLISYLVMFMPLLLLARQEAINVFSELNYVFTTVYGKGFIALQHVMVICSVLGGTIQPLLAITIGAQVSKKYKLLTGIGIYFGLNMIVSFITSIVSGISAVADIIIMDAAGAMTLTYLVPSILYLIIAVGGYFLMHYLVTNKLNLT